MSKAQPVVSHSQTIKWPSYENPFLVAYEQLFKLGKAKSPDQLKELLRKRLWVGEGPNQNPFTLPNGGEAVRPELMAADHEQHSLPVAGADQSMDLYKAMLHKLHPFVERNTVPFG